ncbi:hypothetical protein [Pseudorhodoferax sp. Leaf274]|uniref:hypothetical protein n=1 Tax=Pseudorhodoferax sp. Leaf274 TaxID=1736318 RepID=UPI0007035334|nr:hypothetical protein [Pseudorhodoferax sp. Leaf274]KQP43921.1 hypothetical protein ASF44_28755 [Pseudorhodoferax sp. Leaf274]
MTCIVGLVHEGRVYIGGDSAGVSGLDLNVRRDQKVSVKSGFAFGFTTSFRMGQLIQYAFEPPKRHPEKDLMAYMVTDFVDALRSCLKAGGFARKDSEVEQGGSFLVGHAGRLFAIHGDYQVAEATCGYDAVGCGEGYAKGALFATAKHTPADRIDMALAAAESHSAGVRGPFHTVSV